MPIRELKDQIARLPEQPGVYLYFNAAGETIYVGKARALRDRVRNYLGAYGGDPKTDALLDEVARLEIIVTDSVVEALALENNLIKQRSPKYNILLRDDKTYPYLQLTTNEAFPRVLVARKVERDGSFYAGPFMPARFARKTMALTHRLFGMRSCNEVITGKRGRPCLEYDIKRCIAPCVDTVCSADEYGRSVALTQLFLQGKNDELLKTLEHRMKDAAERERFEEAAQHRDAMRTVQTLHDRQQKMETTGLGHRDAFGLKIGPAGAVVLVFQVRNGRVVERVELDTETAPAGAEPGAILSAALQQFYELRPGPPEIHLPSEPDEREALESWLSDRAARKVRIVVPQRGEKRGLVDLASRNAALAYQNRYNESAAAEYEALETLRAVLALAALPRRIECFDISTIQGRETVASMVVCEDGRMRRGEYRKYRIRGEAGRAGGAGVAGRAGRERLRPARGERVGARGQGREGPTQRERGWGPASGEKSRAGEPGRATARRSDDDQGRPVLDTRERNGASVSGVGVGPAATPEAESLGSRPRSSEAVPGVGVGPHAINDDFASMHEVVGRRYRKLLEEGGPFPDLVVIDGGKGQLSSAYAALEELGLANLVAVGLAKKEELLYTREREDPIALGVSDPALLLVQRIRDEAHRFAVTFHRRRRAMRDLRSELDDIPGVGPRRRRALLTKFGSLAGVRRATREELEAEIGAKTADVILAFFARRP